MDDVSFPPVYVGAYPLAQSAVEDQDWDTPEERRIAVLIFKGPNDPDVVVGITADQANAIIEALEIALEIVDRTEEFGAR